MLAGGKDDEDRLMGGVLDREGSFVVVECVEGGNVGSGDNVGGVGCGIEFSNSSERRRVENVRFASSAVEISARWPIYCSGFSDVLFWKWSSPCGVRFLTFDGVAGDPSSCNKLKLA